MIWVVATRDARKSDRAAVKSRVNALTLCFDRLLSLDR